MGYAGVNLDGTPDKPFAGALASGGGSVHNEGIRGAPYRASTIESAINSLCDNWLRHLAHKQAQSQFKPEEACHALHEWMKK